MTEAIGVLERTPSRVTAFDGSTRMLAVALGALIVIQLWFGLIGSSLWIDETGTWWIIKDGPIEVIHRAIAWSGQSPFYYLLAWGSARIFGLNEIGMRLPSVFALSGAVFFLFRLAELLCDRLTAVLSCLIFLIVASFYAIDARPYALSLLCVTASMWAVVNWVETKRLRYGSLYIVSGAALLYAHCIMGLSLGPSAIYGAVCLWNQRKRLLVFLGMQGAVLLACIPLAGELRTFYVNRGAHAFQGLPGWADIMTAMIPCGLTGAFLVVVWLLLYMNGRTDGTVPVSQNRRMLIALWAFFAPAVLFLLPLVSDLKLLTDRYYSSALPAQALLLGLLVRSIKAPMARSFLLGITAALAVFAQGRLASVSHGNEDWKNAMSFLRSSAGDAPVMLVSGFVEASDFDKLRDPQLREILFAPELFYGEPRGAIRLPNVFDGRDSVEMEKIVHQIASAPVFYLVSERGAKNYELWLRGRFGVRCEAGSVGRNFGFVTISRFVCGDAYVVSTK